jgi:hypothetical protein
LISDKRADKPHGTKEGLDSRDEMGLRVKAFFKK